MGVEGTRSGQKVGLFATFLLLPLFQEASGQRVLSLAQLEPKQQRMWEARAGLKKQPLPMNECPAARLRSPTR